MDVVLLARLQFALTIAFHYIFPPLTIGMGVVMVFLEARYLATGDRIYEVAARFWTRIFALNFAIGVATGIVMEFQFGTNWAAYSRFVGDVFGSALAAEGIFAFFLESGFLALLVFGWDRISPKMHFFSTCMVALGSIFSSVWIVVANSWQQTPAGHHIVPLLRDGRPLVIDGEPVLRAEIVDFWALVFNPSTVHRLVHVWIGAFILGSFFIMSISAYYLLRRRHVEFARRSLEGALLFATIASLAAVVSGHFQARTVYRYQPAKLAAFEAHYRTGPADLSLIGVPDDAAERIRFNLAIPGGLSFLVHDDFDQPVVGLDRFRPADRPPVLLSFASYHVMIGLGTLFVVVTLLAAFLYWRRRLFETRWLLWVLVFAVAGPVIANELGWVAAEVGRQPWIVHPPVAWTEGGDLVVGPDGVVSYDESLGLRTADAVSPAVEASQVAASIAAFGLIYACLLAVWLYLLDKKIRHGPEPLAAPDAAGREGVVAVAARLQDHSDSLTGSAES
ncbi:MAG TPA: cytochrome ubiquinol oxidase subunit I [Thermoanaerobaculales bacterium]|nr:cytochrome ubiquinol oxidase subunit I [Thermoanaerobaculales bacterium]HPA80212.1 cytochrome ubiquinol oxidase subunit I [Thermoanaerobaculales bacterium]HQN97688.1 cytochrome ubiquinol oxidase subunit I [Thermoanaerobaculales bacterium]HQP44452.1 cytochrome ubiquinol oxidase subunit I [Thermoanaerobaculales bacterium]